MDDTWSVMSKPAWWLWLNTAKASMQPQTDCALCHNAQGAARSMQQHHGQRCTASAVLVLHPCWWAVWEQRASAPHVNARLSITSQCSAAAASAAPCAQPMLYRGCCADASTLCGHRARACTLAHSRWGREWISKQLVSSASSMRPAPCSNVPPHGTGMAARAGRALRGSGSSTE